MYEIYGRKSSGEMFPNIPLPDNKPIIITFLAMEKVILLCTDKTHAARNCSGLRLKKFDYFAIN